MKNNSIFEESPQKTRRERQNPAMAFFVAIKEQELLTINPKKLDASFKNQLQDLNLQFSIIYRDFSAQDDNGSYVMRTFDAPSFVSQHTSVWDVCFFSFPYIIETNVMVPSLPQQAGEFFSYYTKLSVFLKNRKETNLNQTLGNNPPIIMSCRL